MPEAIEREPIPRRPVVTYHQEHLQETQLVESIAGINEGCAACLIILMALEATGLLNQDSETGGTTLVNA